ncbi:MAG: DUF5615 family PIN-like protein [Anaerolineae bacterium]|nr:DUF5615 family PIN-like protein [Anaerolineae bacterium]
MKLLVDMPLSPALAPWLRAQGHDAVHATEIGLARAQDSDILDYAQRGGYTVVTADLDFPHILALTHAGEPSVILFRGGNYNEAQMRELLERVLKVFSERALQHSITVVDQKRIRRTTLPIGSRPA